MKLSRRLLAVTAVVGLLALSIPAMTLGADDTAGQCDGYNNPANTKVDTSNDDLVLEAGLTVCIHASNGNTGSFVTDGTSTLHEYIVASGLLNEGGQVPQVSNYVVYGAAPTPTPTPTPTPPDDDNPTPTPTATPTPTPTPTPPDDDTPTPTPTPTTPPDDDTPTPTPTPVITAPPTDTAPPTSGSNGSSVPLLLILLLGISGGMFTITELARRKR